MSGYFGNLFQGIGQARPNLGGSYFSEGFSGVVVLDALKGQNSQKTQIFQIIAEFRILETNQPDKHPVGGSASFVMSTDKAPWKGNYTGLLAALWGIDPGNEEAVRTNITSEVGEAAIDKTQPCRGKAVMLTTSTGKKTQKGNPLTVHYWKPVDQAKYTSQIQQIFSSPTVAPKVEAAPSAGPPAGFSLPQAPSAPALPFLAAPAAPPAPPAPPALPFLAAPPPVPPAPPAVSEWQTHPQNPAFEWNLKTGELRPKA